VNRFVCSLIAIVNAYWVRIQHPFLFDNRHYTFYVWRRVFKLHQVMPYLMVPGYLACIWAWFLRVGEHPVRVHSSSFDNHLIGPDQTILQTLLLPACVLPTLLPTPLLEPRYFLIPYILLRAQVPDVPSWGIALEGLWYACINAVTMWVFLYREREGVGRFMW
jgi:alpha-1,2-glucosyltransferase